MKILSFDQSTVKTGYAVFDGADLIAHGVIDLHKDKDAWEREQLMRIRIKDLIKQNRPKVVVLEGVSAKSNPQTVIMLGRLQGHIMSAAWDKNADVKIYLPTEWRKIDGIKQGPRTRKELKEQSIALVANAYGLDLPEDEAEAIAIGIAYLKDSGVIPDETKE